MTRPARRGGLSALALVCAWAGCSVLARPVLAADAAAAGGPSSLSQSLARLRDNPADAELRKSIIAAVLAGGAPPAMPAEAAEAKGWGDAAFKNARAPADYLEAAKAYEKSLALAPWAAAGYVGLAGAQEKAGRYSEAAASLRFYLLAAPGAPDALAVSERIGALSYQAQHPPKAGDQGGSGADEAAAPLDARAKELLLKTQYKVGFQCGHDAPVKALRKRETMACDQAELDAEMWHAYEILGARAYRLADDGSLELWSVHGLGNVLELSGKPTGPALKDVRWRVCRRGRCAKRIWARVADDLSTITYSPDRPVEEPADPHARYSYIQYRLN